jgi:purine nucleoside phosphorylase
MKMSEAKLGVIGGSGLYEIEGLKDVKEVKVKTPFGEPSDAIILGTLGKIRVAFLPRHGRGHRYGLGTSGSRNRQAKWGTNYRRRYQTLRL